MSKKIPTCVSLGCDSFFYDDSQPCSFEADPDIAGLGVILPFSVSMILAFFLSLYGFYFIENNFTHRHLTKLDHTIIATAQKVLRKFSTYEGRALTQQVFGDALLQFSDTQLVTGLAVLIIGFAQMDTISSYHFSVVSDLANMAFVVHLSTIDILARKLVANPQSWWRVFGIVTIALGTFATNIPGLNGYYLDKFGAPVKCAWTSIVGNADPYWTAQTAIYMALDVWAMFDMYYSLFPSQIGTHPAKFIIEVTQRCLSFPSSVYRHAQRKITSLQNHDGSSARMLIWKIIAKLAYAGSFVTFLGTEIAFSEAFSLMRNWSFLLQNLYDAFDTRKESNRHIYHKLGNEDTFGFGQLVLIVLLALPTLTLLEVYFNGQRKRKIEDAWRRQELDETLKLKPVDSAIAQSSDDIPLVHRRTDEHVATAMEHSNVRHDTGHDPASQRIFVFDTLSFAELYEKAYFRIIMQVTMFLILTGVTIAAVYDWTF